MNNNDITNESESSQPAHWGFGGTVLWGSVAAVIFIIAQIITLVVLMISQHKDFSESEFKQWLIANNGSFLSLTSFVATVVCCSFILAVIKLKKGSVLKEYLAIKPVSRETMLKWLGFLAGLIVLSDLLTTLLGRPLVPESMISAYQTANPLWMLWVTMMIAAPLLEETFFRGFLFKGFESSFLGPVGTVLVTAGLWAGIHLQYDAYGMATIFCLGLLLGAARLLTGSLLVPLVLHAAANLIATIETAILSGSF